MLSKKCQKYMKQYQERNYAPKIRKIEKSDLGKYRNGNQVGKAESSSCGNCLQQGGKIQEEKVIHKGDENETIRKENACEAYQEGRQGISGANQGRYETEEKNPSQTKEEIMKKQTSKEKKHEARETKAYEKKEDKKSSKAKKKSK